MNQIVYNEKQVRSAYGAYVLTYMAEAEGRQPEEIIKLSSNGDVRRVRKALKQFQQGRDVLAEASILLGHIGVNQASSQNDFMAAGQVNSPIVVVPTNGQDKKRNFRPVALRQKRRRYFMFSGIDVVIVPRIVH